jgi:hypothetical protein
MRKLILATATCAAVALTGVASAKVKKAEDPNRVLCRIETASGSRITQRRICMTRAEWKLDEEARAKDAQNSQRATWDLVEQEATRGATPGARLGPK